jgi:hypothetical protein
MRCDVIPSVLVAVQKVEEERWEEYIKREKNSNNKREVE